MSLRIQKINELLKQEISDLILRELDFSRDTLITVTKVDTSKDLLDARVGVSVLPFLKAEKVMKVLNSQVFNIQKVLDKRLKIKVVPKIRFELDKSYERADRVNSLLKQI